MKLSDLIKSVGDYESILENSFNSLWIGDKQGTLIWQNKANKKLFGEKDEDVVGKYNLFKDDVLREKGLIPLIEKVFKQKQAVDFFIEYDFSQVKNVNPSSPSFTFLEVSIYPILDKNNEIQFVVVQHKDLTKLHFELQKFKTMAASAKDAIISIDDEGKVTYWNKAAEKIFGYSAEEVMGKDLHSLIAPEKYLSAFKKGFEIFSKTGKGNVINKTIELEGKRKNGEVFPIELSLASFKIRNKFSAVAVVRDITERKKMQNELKKYSEKLEEEVEAKAKELKEVYISRNLFLSSILFAASKLAIERKDVHVQVDLMFEAFEQLFNLTGVKFVKSKNPLDAVEQAHKWLVENHFMKPGQMVIGKTSEGGIEFHLTSACPFVDEGRLSQKAGIKIHCLLGLFLLYFIKKVTGEYGFVVNTKKFDEKGCTVVLEPIFGS